MIEGATQGPRDIVPDFDFANCGSIFGGVYIGNNGYTPELARERIARGEIDMVAFGKAFISNPDLVDRLKQGRASAEANRETFYGGGAEGYTDYPTLAGEAA